MQVMAVSMNAPDNKSKYKQLDPEFLHSAAIIDADGREVAITREMIDRACEKLASQFEQFQHPSSSNQSHGSR